MAVDSVTSSSPYAKALQFIEDVTRDVDSVQKRVLSEILSQNSDTEYLSRFGLGGSTDRAAFKSKVPVVLYEDLWPDIERIANGEKSNILCSRPISEFFIGSAA